MPIEIRPIATVRSTFTPSAPRPRRREIIADLVFRDELLPALAGIEEWSHLIVLFWMPRPCQWPGRLSTHPRHREDLPRIGVFAGRGRERPNPIGLAVVEQLHRDGSVVTVRGLDAFDGSDVLDVKPYDRHDVVAPLRTPAWWEQLVTPPR